MSNISLITLNKTTYDIKDNTIILNIADYCASGKILPYNYAQKICHYNNSPLELKLVTVPDNDYYYRNDLSITNYIVFAYYNRPGVLGYYKYFVFKESDRSYVKTFTAGEAPPVLDIAFGNIIATDATVGFMSARDKSDLDKLIREQFTSFTATLTPSKVTVTLTRNNSNMLSISLPQASQVNAGILSASYFKRFYNSVQPAFTSYSSGKTCIGIKKDLCILRDTDNAMHYGLRFVNKDLNLLATIYANDENNVGVLNLESDELSVYNSSTQFNVDKIELHGSSFVYKSTDSTGEGAIKPNIRLAHNGTYKSNGTYNKAKLILDSTLLSFIGMDSSYNKEIISADNSLYYDNGIAFNSASKAYINGLSTIGGRGDLTIAFSVDSELKLKASSNTLINVSERDKVIKLIASDVLFKLKGLTNGVYNSTETLYNLRDILYKINLKNEYYDISTPLTNFFKSNSSAAYICDSSLISNILKYKGLYANINTGSDTVSHYDYRFTAGPIYFHFIKDYSGSFTGNIILAGTCYYVDSNYLNSATNLQTYTMFIELTYADFSAGTGYGIRTVKIKSK